MSKPSKRDLDRLEREKVLRERLAAGEVLTHPPVADDPSHMRARGAGVGRMVSALEGGLQGELDRAKEDVARLTGEMTQTQAEVERLRSFEQLADGQQVVLKIATDKIAPTRFSNRIAAAYTDSDKAFNALKADIEKTGGNITPALVVRLGGDSSHEFELVYGHRRFHACSQLGLPLSAIVASLEDDEISSRQQRENNHRTGLSPVEQGLQVESYLALSRNESGNQPKMAVAALAESLDMNVRSIQRLGLIGRIPTAVLAVLGDYRSIPLRSAAELGRLCQDDFKSVAERMESMPPDLTPRKRAEHLINKNATRDNLSAGEYALSLPKDKESRDLVIARIRAIEQELELSLLRRPLQ